MTATQANTNVIQSANLPLRPTDLVIMSQRGRSVGAPYSAFASGSSTPGPPGPPGPAGTGSIAQAQAIATWGM